MASLHAVRTAAHAMAARAVEDDGFTGAVGYLAANRYMRANAIANRTQQRRAARRAAEESDDDDDDEPVELSAYEQQRADRMEKNKAFLESLGFT